MKPCTVCKELKELSEFYKLSKARQHKSDGHEARCKTCSKAYQASPENRTRANAAWKHRYHTDIIFRLGEKEKSLKYRSTPEAKAKQAIRSKQWAIDNPEKTREHNIKSCANYRKTPNFKIAIDKYRAKNPEKRTANIKVMNALHPGLLIRPTTCSSCNAEYKPEGHHPDYSKQLEVIWLCKQCHENIHHLST